MPGQRRSNSPTRRFSEPRALGPGALRPFVRARGWLSGLLLSEAKEKGTGPERWCNFLLGCWICDSLTGLLADEFPATVRMIGSELTFRAAADWSKTPPTLKLLAAVLFERYQVHVAFLHDDNGYVSQAQSFLLSRSRSKSEDAISFYDKYILMHGMRRVARPASPPLSQAVRFARSLSLADVGSAREHLFRLISASSQLGKRSVTLRKAAAWMEDLLLGFAMAALRKYDLTEGCRWMRAACYLGLRGARLESCTQFLCLHQRPEGPFGYYDTENTAVAKSSGNPVSVFRGSSINLPVTVECLWTLAEVSTPWRLSRKVFE